MGFEYLCSLLIIEKELFFMTLRNLFIRSTFLLAFYLVSFTPLTGQGDVVFHENAMITNLMNRFLAFNTEHSTITGWKIQIISTNDRREMDEVRSKFMNLFPGTPVVWKHVVPNYQVRVGSFRTKTELMDMMQDIRRSFPMSTPVIDNIEKKDLIDYD